MADNGSYANDDRVIVNMGDEGDVSAVVVDKSRGAATKVRLSTGQTLLVATRIIRKA